MAGSVLRSHVPPHFSPLLTHLLSFSPDEAVQRLQELTVQLLLYKKDRATFWSLLHLVPVVVCAEMLESLKHEESALPGPILDALFERSVSSESTSRVRTTSGDAVTSGASSVRAVQRLSILREATTGISEGSSLEEEESQVCFFVVSFSNITVPRTLQLRPEDVLDSSSTSGARTGLRHRHLLAKVEVERLGKRGDAEVEEAAVEIPVDSGAGGAAAGVTDEDACAVTVPVGGVMTSVQRKAPMSMSFSNL
jgi:hypothetical protein